MERRHLSCGLTVDVAITEAQWQAGLSDITEWDGLDGMLFEFPEAKRWPVYMMNMDCDLHAYWLQEDGTIVAQTWMPKTSTVYYLPILDACFLLETRLPMTWQVGDTVSLEAVHDPFRHANTHPGEAE
jgi:uncharacterized membrane protein (UPF0127 family)